MTDSLTVVSTLTDPVVAVEYTAEDGALAPEKKSPGAAGADLAVLHDVLLEPRQAVLARTGVKAAIPHGYAGLIFERSSFSVKYDCSLTNKVGLIDSDYRGELFLSLRNDSQTMRKIPAGTRVAQLVLLKVWDTVFVPVERLSDTDRGAGGFGSTG